MSDVLTKICNTTREEVARRKAAVSLADIEAEAKLAEAPRGFANALTIKAETGAYALIAEIKKASPSAGLIRPDFNPADLAQCYFNAGAACLSVLTDEPYFQGHADYLKAARGSVPLPALRKDFMVDLWQVPEARAMGADAILVIMAALEDSLAAEMEAAAFEWGMDVLVEIHNAEELERAIKHLKSPLLGINNRNLKTLKTDIATTEELGPLVADANRQLVAESGLNSPESLARMARAGARRFLIGESLMKQVDVTAATRAILANPYPMGS